MQKEANMQMLPMLIKFAHFLGATGNNGINHSAKKKKKQPTKNRAMK